MSNFYTIQKGDTYWGIVKNQLGANASNADILKGVNDLALANNKSDPRSIRADEKVDISIFSKTPPVATDKSAENKQTPVSAENPDASVFTARPGAQEAYNSYEKSDTVVSALFMYAQDAQEDGYSGCMDKLTDSKNLRNYKFTPEGYMNLPQEEKAEAYKESILKLGEGEMQMYDKDKNGNLSFEEFRDEQLAKIAKAEKFLAKALGREYAVTKPDENFDIEAKKIFETLNVNNADDVLDVKELATNYAFMDGGNPVKMNVGGEEKYVTNAAYDQNMNPVKDANGNQRFGMDGRIMEKDAAIKPDNIVLQGYYDNFFAQ